jgi:hypothetical protein
MIPSVLERATFGIAVMALYATGRLSGRMLAFGLIDLALGVLFVVAYVRTTDCTSPAGQAT